MSPKLIGPTGSTIPSRPSSSLSAVNELATLGLRADADELLFDLPSLLVPPNRVPRLSSPHSNSSWVLIGVLGILRADNRSGSPSAGNWKSASKSSSQSFFWGVGGM